MKFHMLLTEDVPTIPSNVTITDNWGPISVILQNGQIINGEHVAIEADKEHVIQWLKPLNGFWLGKGSPMMQQFEISHVK